LAVVGTTAERSDAVLASSPGLELTPVSDVHAFAEAVARLAADEPERRRRGAAARQLYLEAFDWDAIVQRLLPIIRAGR
jgi:glycosyltransferase involved in cell wall biosynthesis